MRGVSSQECPPGAVSVHESRSHLEGPDVGGHEFDDDDIAWPEGSDIALRSEYAAMIEIRDTGSDHQRQQEVAGQIFTALKPAGWWRAAYIDDMQKVLDSYNLAQ